MKKIFSYFIQGLLYTAPIGITVFILYQVFFAIDSVLSGAIRHLFNIDFPGLGVVVIIIFLVLVGMVGQSIIAKPFKFLFKRMMDRTPVLRVLYSSINDLITAFVGKEKKFKKPVLVTLNPNSNLKKLGFLTKSDLSMLGTDNSVAVYFPHSYNFSGELFIVPADQVELVKANSADVMKFIVSAGVTGFE